MPFPHIKTTSRQKFQYLFCLFVVGLPFVVISNFIVQLQVLSWMWSLCIVLLLVVVSIMLSLHLKHQVDENPYYLCLLAKKRRQVHEMREALIEKETRHRQSINRFIGTGGCNALNQEKNMGQKKAPE